MLFPELVERLKKEEETSLVELLGLTSEDIVERCLDIVDEKFDYLKAELYDGEEVVNAIYTDE